MMARAVSRSAERGQDIYPTTLRAHRPLVTLQSKRYLRAKLLVRYRMSPAHTLPFILRSLCLYIAMPTWHSLP
jgi:hypothetical protein